MTFSMAGRVIPYFKCLPNGTDTLEPAFRGPRGIRSEVIFLSDKSHVGLENAFRKGARLLIKSLEFSSILMWYLSL